MDQANLARDFFHTMYHPVMDDDGRLTDGHYLRLYQRTTDGNQRVQHFQDPNALLEYCQKTRTTADCYFSLATTNGQGGSLDDLAERTVLGFDFDGASLSDVMVRFGQARLFYHAIVSSGHGFHVYLAIEPTRDHKRVETVQKAMAAILGADPNAAKTTQILRVPGTLNHKSNPVGVHVVKLYPLETIRRYNLDRLERRFVFCDRPDDAPARIALSTTNMPPCIEDILRSGSIEGTRNSHLLNVVVMLRKRGKTLPQILALCHSWAEKSDFRDNLEYRVEYIYKNQQQPVMTCSECEHRAACRVTIESDFDFSDDHVSLRMSENHIRRLMEKGERAMKPNDLLIYGVLKLHQDGLTVDEVMERITYRNKPAISETPVRAALKSLVEAGLAEVDHLGSEHKRVYRIRSVSSLPEMTFDISYAATANAIRGLITPTELRLYTYIRSLHNKQQREGTAQLRGNLFQCSHQELADALGVSRVRITQMIGNLIREKMMDVWSRQPSKNNGWDFNVYRLAC